MKTIIKNRPRRSEKLSPQDWKSYRKLIRSFNTKTEAAEFIGIGNVVLDMVSIKGSGAPETIFKIRAALAVHSIS